VILDRLGNSARSARPSLAHEKTRTAFAAYRATWKRARYTFTYTDPAIGPVRIARGERLDPRHVAVEMHPGKFEGLTGERQGGGKVAQPPKATAESALARQLRIRRETIEAINRKTVGAPAVRKVSAARTKTRPGPLLRASATPRTTVRIARIALRDIRAAAADARDGRENGGAVFVRHPNLGSSGLTISHADGPGPDAKRGEFWVSADLDDIRAHVREFVEVHDNREVRWGGTWHTHPRLDGQSRADYELHGRRPSAGDLATWLERLDSYRDDGREPDYYLGIIATVGESSRLGFMRDDWTRPEFHGWIVSYQGYTEKPVCEPVTLELAD
jgi:hypothetical protein